MPVNPIRNELEEISIQFESWRKEHPHRHYPKRLWKHALILLETRDIKEVAKATGYPPSYLLRKAKSQPSPLPVLSELQFVEIQPQPQVMIPDLSANSEIRLHLKKSGDAMAELSFQGSVSELFPLLSNLFKEGDLCSK